MHIPDNFLSTPVWATLDGIALPAIALVSRKAQKETDTNRLPLLGVMGAFVFAAQMINFPVGLGTSGHLIGGALLACVLGPWAASLVITAILIIQALVFQDGGVLALGANVVNMALLGVFAGYLPARALSETRWESVGVFLGGACSVMVSGTLALTYLLVSGIHMPRALVLVSLGLFFVNAVAEGAITLSVLRAIRRLNAGDASAPHLLLDTATTARNSKRKLLIAVLVSALILASVGILIASTLPDGLQHIADALGISSAAHPVLHSPLSDYQVEVLGTAWFSRAVAGLCGLFLIYMVCTIGGHLLGRVRRSWS
jgi:cobalt/nickel transport system permease protein